MDIAIKIIQFFLCFTILVGLHEFGHFLMARLFGIRVEKFYIFFDPWFSLFKFKHKGTEYGLGWLPLGGYVKIAGMIDESLDKEQMKQPVRSDEFRAKPAWQRFLVMIAGVTVNLLLAAAIYVGVSFAWGDSYFANEDARWGYNFNESAHALGFVDGDRILSIDGRAVDNPHEFVSELIITDGDRRVEVERDGMRRTLLLPMDRLIELRKERGYEAFFTFRMPFIADSVVSPSARAAGILAGDQMVALNGERIVDYEQFRERLRSRKGESVTLTLLRDGRERETTLTLDGEGTIGVVARNPFVLRTRHYTFAEAIPAGFRRAGQVVSDYWEQLKMIVQPRTKMYEEVGGFVAIGSIFSSEWNWQDFWLKTAFLSIILAVMNLLPIPGLDGGHALFTLWEMATGRKVADRVLEAAQYAGLLLILGLLIYANGNDIYRFFIK